ncbi:MAG: hypothetical protein I3273_02600 [Candidatus Moeniiplasma glomeromycotorum]|nr:hypothetical protein [Candidatus Moeniiplasma glomeromycotorum]MCE8167654.1 hypothetical protein [Candidatus Moeniiplasma glomeromycotorum]MCE8168995.1 hypothetical protein [Candidatus Moeniiplasma glomeromycotorum]
MIDNIHDNTCIIYFNVLRRVNLQKSKAEDQKINIQKNTTRAVQKSCFIPLIPTHSKKNKDSGAIVWSKGNFATQELGDERAPLQNK